MIWYDMSVLLISNFLIMFTKYINFIYIFSFDLEPQVDYGSVKYKGWTYNGDFLVFRDRLDDIGNQEEADTDEVEDPSRVVDILSWVDRENRDFRDINWILVSDVIRIIDSINVDIRDDDTISLWWNIIKSYDGESRTYSNIKASEIAAIAYLDNPEWVAIKFKEWWSIAFNKNWVLLKLFLYDWMPDDPFKNLEH